MRANEFVTERKKYKRKSRGAAYGPGPYGGYGYYAGYSGDSGAGGDGGGESSLEEGVNDPHTFKCIFLFGPMGAGKSTVANPLLTDTGLRSVNLDNFNELFIKKGQVPTGHLSPDQLEKSWQLTQKQQQNFIDGRLGVIIDGSGRNPSTAIGVIEKLAPLGYEFMMIFVNVSEATSIARQQSRADKQQKQWGVGRQVDPTLAKDTYTQVQKNLSKYSAYFGPQRFVYVDNENTPDLTQVTKKVEAFLRAPVRQPEALAWIQSQKGGEKVAQQQKKLAAAQDRQQQALKQFNPLNPKFAKNGMAENFADGKNPQDKGDSKRHGVPTKASVSTLRKVAKQGGRKGQLAHWMANMKSGRSKKK
jgi:adenylate kinase family enzyme